MELCATFGDVAVSACEGADGAAAGAELCAAGAGDEGVSDLRGRRGRRSVGRGGGLRCRPHFDPHAFLRRESARPVGRGDRERQRMIARRKRLLQDRAPFALVVGGGRGHFRLAALHADLPARRGAAGDHALAARIDHDHVEGRHDGRLGGSCRLRLGRRMRRRLRQRGGRRRRRLARLRRCGRARRSVLLALEGRKAALTQDVDRARAGQETNANGQNDRDRVSADHP